MSIHIDVSACNEKKMVQFWQDVMKVIFFNQSIKPYHDLLI